MAYLGQCAPERIPMTLVEGAVEDEVEHMRALAALAEVSLLRHDPFEDGSPAVTVHRLVQAVARARSEAIGSAQAAAGRLTARLVATYPRDGHANPQAWPFCAKLTPHLLVLHEAAGPNGASEVADWPDLLNRAGSYFHGRAAYSQALPLFREALAISEKTLGPEHPDTAKSLNNLALLLKGLADFAEARSLFERVVRITQKALGPEHPATATGLNNLAGLFKDQGDFAGARPLYERALAIYEKALGPEHPDTAMTLVNLAILFQEQGDLETARPLLEQAVRIFEKAFGPEHPQTATSLNNLALLSEARESAAAQGLFASASAQINCGIIRAAGSKDPQGLLIGRSRSCRSCIGDRSPPGACRQCGAAPTAAPTPLGRVVCSHPLNVAGPDRPRKVVCGKLPVRPWTAG